MATVDRINGLTGNLGIKAPVRVATTANLTLSGLQTIDGVTVVAGDRVLVKNQTTASQNGIYAASATAWVREPDFDGSRDIVKGTIVYVYDGSANQNKFYQVSTSNPIVVGTSNITFIQVSTDLTGLGLGTIATQAASAVALTGGTIVGVTINNAVIGGVTPAAGTFTALTALAGINPNASGGNALTNFVVNTYTPTLTNTTNVEASTAFTTYYMRINNYCLVFGFVSIDPTATGAIVLNMSTPIATNFNSAVQVGGVAMTSAVAGQALAITADGTLETLSFRGVTTDAANRSYQFNAWYLIQ